MPTFVIPLQRRESVDVYKTPPQLLSELIKDGINNDRRIRYNPCVIPMFFFANEK